MDTKTPNSEKRIPKNDIKFNIQLSDEQKQVKASCFNYRVNVITGEAGTSKTLTACNVALDFLFKRKVDRITLMRPTVATEEIGLMPGDLNDKMMHWMLPVLENMKLLVGKQKVEKLLSDELIRILPLQFTQGVTFYKEVVILDEAQNTTKEQMSMVLTRTGKESNLIIAGDPKQVQLKNKSNSGLKPLLDIKEKTKLINYQELKENYRDPVVREILNLYQTQ